MLNSKSSIPKEVLEQELELMDVLEQLEDSEDKKDYGPYIAS